MTAGVKSSEPKTVMDPQAITLGRAYGQALADYASVDDVQNISSELNALVDLVRDTPGCQEFLTNATLNRSTREAMVKRIFAGRVSSPVEQLLGILAANDRMNILHVVARQFEKILDERIGKIDVNVTTAVELNENELEQLHEVLAQNLGLQPNLLTEIDPELIGGVVVRVGDAVYDGSVAGELARITEAMTKKGIESK